MMPSCIIAAIFTTFIIKLGDCSRYRLQEAQSASGCLGGEVCSTQPSVAVLDSSTGQIDYSFVGSVYATIGSSPTSYESLFQGTGCNSLQCNSEVVGSSAVESFVNGIATFTGLFFTTAGNYKIKYFGKMSTGQLFAMTTGSDVTVSTGLPFKLSLVQPIGNCFGGAPFLSSPRVAVVDRGENVITSLSMGTISASIAKAPSGNVVLRPVNDTVQPISSGVANFESLFIDEAGGPLQISFVASLEGIYNVSSDEFTVAIGPPASLEVADTIGGQTIYGGEFFRYPPVVRLRDLGGNLVSHDSSSGVSLRIFDNPTGAVLMGEREAYFQVALGGIVTFRSVAMDKVGLNYSLLFELHKYSELENKFHRLDVSVASTRFDVVPGPPRQILSLATSEVAWAGWQPFNYQPLLVVADYGGNPSSSVLSSVEVSMVESVSVHKTVVVDTTNAPQTDLVRVSASIADGVYGVGQLIRLTLHAQYPVYVNSILGNWPVLRLNINNSSGSSVFAQYQNYSAYGSLELSFDYVIQDGDYMDGVSLLNPDSLQLNNASIVDGNFREINLTVPFWTLETNMTIWLDPPIVVSVAANTSSLTYGAGQVIRYSLEFDQSVVVVGYPYLLLNAVSTVSNSSSLVVANFSSVSNDSLVVNFDYVIAEGDSSNGDYLSLTSAYIQLSNVTANVTYVQFPANITVGNNSYVYRDTLLQGSSILMKSTYPSKEVNYSIASPLIASLDSSSSIVVDTSPPALNTSYGFQVHSDDGTYRVGDEVLCSVAFDMEVEVTGVGLSLYVDVDPPRRRHEFAAGLEGRASFVNVSDDRKIVYFKYVVEPGANCSSLEIHPGGSSLVSLSSASTVKRWSTFPTTNANLSTFGVRNDSSSLHQNAISIYGFPAVVTMINATYENKSVLRPDDEIIVAVSFSAPVVTTCYPVFILKLQYFREAQYIDGNGTSTLWFKYVTQVGDMSTTGFGYRNRPNGLCTVTGCPIVSPCRILVDTTSPQQSAELNVPGSDAQVMPLSSVIVSPYPIARNTTISEVWCEEGEYTLGSEISIAVKFSDPVSMFNASVGCVPRLSLNFGESAVLLSGTGSDTWVFSFYVLSVRNVTRSVITLRDSESFPISCYGSPSFEVVNAVGRSVAQEWNSTNGLSLNLTNVMLDFTTPNVSEVYLGTSVGNFSAGSDMVIVIVPNKPVVVVGVPPRVKVLVGSTEVFATYVESLSSDSSLAFVLPVIEGISQTRELVLLSGIIDLMGGYSQIYRLSTVPTLEMNVTIPFSFQILSNPFFIVDSVSIPTVQSVECVSNLTRVFRAGDSIDFVVLFTRPVAVFGAVVLQLDVGKHVRNATMIGILEGGNMSFIGEPPNLDKASNASKWLLFSYEVEVDDFTYQLDYPGIHSLVVGTASDGRQGFVRAYADMDSMDADLTLPVPGEMGSISSEWTVVVDGRRPVLESISIVNDPGVYGLNDTIYFTMSFSAAVVVATNESDLGPTLQLETGWVDGSAVYVNGSGSETLWFIYSPEPGHFTTQLDYTFDRENFGSVISSFQYNGARILADSQNPHVDAIVWLNPIRGYLRGKSSIKCDMGYCQFLDLFITAPGPDYSLRFSADVFRNSSHRLRSDQVLSVLPSAEQQLKPITAIREEQVGYSVSVDNNVAVLGAPMFNVSVTSIQVVCVEVADTEPQRQVQLISTNVDTQPAIQTFYTTAGIDETVSGYFRLMFGTRGPTRQIAADSTGATISAILRSDIPSLGNVSVSVEPYEFCACYNAFVWTLTFHDLKEGQFSGLTTDGSELSGTGVDISQPETIQFPSFLTGTFTLKGYGKESSPLSHDASASDVVAALAELDLPVFDISASLLTTRNAKSWSVTFDALDLSYEIDLLTADWTGLEGGPNPLVFVKIMQPGYHGPNGISGSFQLSWRENVTSPLASNSSAYDVKLALEALPSINQVNVERYRSKSTLDTYCWVVEFVSYNRATHRGYEVDVAQNVEPMIPIDNLIATDSNIFVDVKWELGRRNRIESETRQGTFGEGSGAAFVFQQSNSSWVEVAQLFANDSKPGAKFGYSVAALNDLVVVGAIGGSMDGVAEVQGIRCVADGGEFQLRFRGWMSDPISYNITARELQTLLQSKPSVLEGLYSVTNVIVDDWGSGTLCSNNTAVITFLSPINGAKELFGEDTYGDLELLALTNNNLTVTNPNIYNASVEIFELQKGTWRLNNNGSDAQQVGAVYVYRTPSCSSPYDTQCIKSSWALEAKLFPRFDSVEGTEFGFSLALLNDTVFVGAPGGSLATGDVYIFYSADAANWAFFQVIRNPLAGVGDRFGHSISVYKQTLVIGAPGYDSERGRVYVFYQTSSGGSYILAQVLDLPVSLLPDGLLLQQENNTKFGHSVSIEQNTLAIGSPGFCDTTTYLGLQHPVRCRRYSGAVFVYKRVSAGTNLLASRLLAPSNVMENDQFGYKVVVHDNLLLVSAYQEFLSQWNSSAPVMFIETSAAVAGVNLTQISGTFKLRWKDDGNKTAYLKTTRSIPFNATAYELKTILEQDLDTHELIVHKSADNLYSNGILWSVTFIHHTGILEPFTPDFRNLKGTNRTVTVKLMNNHKSEHRSKVHVFKRDNAASHFVEEVFLSPLMHQKLDLCGHDISVSKSNALIGCPNRDESVYPNHNSGAGFMYDLSILDVRFSSSNSSVLEGDRVHLQIERDSTRIPDGVYIEPYTDVHYTVSSFDRNANYSLQQRVADLYGIMNGSLSETFPPQTPADFSGLAGKAVATSQFYGNQSQRYSEWVNGRFDFRAVSDYVPVEEVSTILAEWNDNSLQPAYLTANFDHITEIPSENVSVVISSPGVWPSPLGHLFHHVTIVDVDEQVVDEHSQPWYSHKESQYKLVNQDNQDLPAAESQYFGQVIAVDRISNAVAVGMINATVRGVLHAGKVLVYRFHPDFVETDSQHMQPDTVLYSPALTVASDNETKLLTNDVSFGNALAIQSVLYAPHCFDSSCMESTRNLTILAVAQSSAEAVHLYVDRDGQFVFAQTLSIEAEFGLRPLFGTALSLHEDMLFISAPGLEEVHVFNRLQNISNLQSINGLYSSVADSIIRSSDFSYDILMGNIVSIHSQGFGTSMSSSGRYIVISSPHALYDFRGENDLVQDFQSDGVDILRVGKGKVYVFYNAPSIWRTCILSSTVLKSGAFFVEATQNNQSYASELLHFNTTAKEMKRALESAFGSVGSVEVHKFVGERLEDDAHFHREGIESLDDELSFKEYTEFSDAHGLFGDRSSVPLGESSQAQYATCWDIALMSQYSRAPEFSTSYINDTRCQKIDNATSCFQPFDVNSTTNSTLPNTYMFSRWIRTPGSWQEVQTLTSPKPHSGDLFGQSVSVDEDFIVVGAPDYNGFDRVDWNFESGSLDGWSPALGTAFRYQPAFGYDEETFKHTQQPNSRLGKSTWDSAALQRYSGLEGRYYVNTYLTRPSSEFFDIPSALFPAGSIQGAEPVGSLTSNPFQIQGNSISFLIGGGCDVRNVFVELIVDGQSVNRQTGRCDNRMHREVFNTANFLGRTGQLRMVDNSTAEPWGFISADDFRLNWIDLKPSADRQEDNRRKGRVDYAQVGAAFVYRRVYSDAWKLKADARSGFNESYLADELFGTTCNASIYFVDTVLQNNVSEICRWRLEVSLYPSDARGNGMKFGQKVAVHAEFGIVAVAAPTASRFGSYQDSLTNYPFRSSLSSLSNNAAGLQFPVDSEVSTFQNTDEPSFYELGDSVAADVWALLAGRYRIRSASLVGIENPDLRFYENSGAVYLYQRDLARWSYNGKQVEVERWPSIFTAKFQSSDSVSGDMFGAALEFGGSQRNMLFIGSPGQDQQGLVRDSGAAYAVNSLVLALGFEKPLHIIQENDSDGEINIHVSRAWSPEETVRNAPVFIAYATSDVTAKGVVPSFFDHCSTLPPGERDITNCGDYEQTYGLLAFEPGVLRRSFKVRIMDNACHERRPKKFAIDLSVPGANVLVGEKFRTIVRIDDDDIAHGSRFCQM